jgi:hypothetical protein
MNKIDATSEYFLHLLCTGMRGTAPQPVPEGISMEQVYKLAKLHRVDDVAFAAVKRLDGKPDFYERWYKRHCMAITRSATQLYEHGQICRALTEAGVQVLPYKGIVLKGYYPEASMRFMSDIDMLYVVPNEDHERVRAAMESLGYTTEQFGTGVHDTYHKPPLMSVELHRVIFSPDADGYLSNADYMSAAAQCADGTMALPLPYLYFATLSHLVKHLRTDAADLRSVIDLYLLRGAMNAQQIAQTDELCARASLDETNRIMQAIALAIFEQQSPDARTQDCIAYLLRSPADTQGADAKYLGSYQKGGSVGTAKLRYYLHLVLPGYAYMKKNYPVLAKAPVLLPLAWLWRWADVLLHQRGRAKRALHRFDRLDAKDTSRAKDDLAMFGLK